MEKKIYTGRYGVRSDGAVISYLRRHPKEMIGKIGNWGYRMVVLHTGEGKGSRVYRNVHRLVAEAFIPNPEHLPQVNHIDGDKTNNSISNLEWCNPRQNAEHCRDFIGSKSQKINMAKAKEIRALSMAGVRTKELMQKYNLKSTQIRYIIQNKRWRQ